MGQKIDPRNLRMGINKTWKSRWYSDKNYQSNLKQDILLREDLKERLKTAGIASVEIERSVAKIRIIVATSKPGILIGRGGQGVDELKSLIKKKYFSKEKLELQIDIREVKAMEEDAQLVADDMAHQLEKRVSFRRVMKMTIDKVMKSRNIQGIKVELSGRLGGAEMSRREWLADGNLPLQTLRADIDFAKSTGYTTFGTLGVKVWLHKKAIERNNFNK